MQEARVNDFFLVREEGANLTASFRGRGIKGMRLAVPEEYTGAVVMVTEERKAKKPKKSSKYSEDDEEDDEDEESPAPASGGRTGTVAKVFRSMTVWQHDTAPLETDNPAQWMQWPQLAAALHAPVEERRVIERTETEPAL